MDQLKKIGLRLLTSNSFWLSVAVTTLTFVQDYQSPWPVRIAAALAVLVKCMEGDPRTVDVNPAVKRARLNGRAAK